MATRRRIEEPSVKQFFVRVPPPSVPQPLQLEHLIYAPYYYVQRAFDSAGVASPEALLDGAYDSGYYDATERWAQAPGMPQGATLDPAKTDVYVVFGSGDSQTVRRLRQENDEEAILSRTSGVVLTENSISVPGYRTVQFPGADFSTLLAGYSLPADASKLFPNHLEDQVFYVVMTSAPTRPLTVYDVDPSDPSILWVIDDPNVDGGTFGATLLRAPRSIEFYVAGREAQLPMAGNTIASNTASTSASTTVLRNFDRYNDWTVNAVVAGTNTPLSVDIDIASPLDGDSGGGGAYELDINLATDAAGGLTFAVSSEALGSPGAGVDTYAGVLANFPVDVGSVVISVALAGETWTDNGSGVLVAAGGTAANGTINYTTGAFVINWTGLTATGDPATADYTYIQGRNTVAEINEAIARAFRLIERAQNVPLQFSPEGDYFNTPTPFTSGAAATITLAAMSQSWLGTVQAKSVGQTGNSYRVTLQAGALATPSVDRVGNHWIINTGTTPANNTIDAINALLVTKGNLLEITTDTDSSTDLITEFSLGSRRNNAGYIDEVWEVDQSSLLESGLSVGGIEVFGGLMPHYDVDTPNSVSVPLYTEFRALRVDSSAYASTAYTGNRPGLIELREEDWEDIIGEADVDNPASIAVNEFFAASESRRCFLLSPGIVSADEPWGTRASLLKSLDFLQKRDMYHIWIFSDAEYLPQVISEWAVGIGGESFDTPLKRPQIFGFSLKTPSVSPDMPITAGTDAVLVPATTDIVASLDFVASGVVVSQDVIVFNDTGVTGGDVTLQDGRTAFSITAINVGGSPMRVTLGATPGGSFSSGGEAFTVLTPGSSLFSGGTYDSQAAAEAIADYQQLSGNYHKRVVKHLIDEYDALINGVFTTVDGVYALGKFAGLVANSPDHLPVSSREYPSTRFVRGTSDIFTRDQLEILTGAGIVMPVQRAGSSEGPTYVFRDVSSDTSTRTFQRRTAGVSEDKLTIEIDRIIKPRLGPNLVTESFLDRIAMDLSKLYDSKVRSGEFAVLTLRSVLPITDEVRERFGTDESGVLILSEIRHLEEATTAIVQHTVNPS